MGGITCIILAVSLVLTAVVTKNRETTKNKETAERAVDQFHHQLDSRQYYEIYGGAADAYRRSIKQSDAIILYETVNRKLGSVMKSNQNGWGINYAPDGAMLSLAYTTEFIHGNATEQFVWIVVGNKASLYQYNINSRLLLDLDYASPNNSYNPTPR